MFYDTMAALSWLIFFQPNLRPPFIEVINYIIRTVFDVVSLSRKRNSKRLFTQKTFL